MILVRGSFSGRPIGLFQKKKRAGGNRGGGGAVEEILFGIPQGIFRFFTLPLQIPDKTRLYP